MKILSIETSCDDTAIALLEASGTINKPVFKVLKSRISSQNEIHRPWGGVVPNLAKREHMANLPIVLEQIIDDKKKAVSKIDMLCVTVGPGLEPSLWTGINFALELKKKLRQKNPKLKTIGVNHLEGHLMSFFLDKKIGAKNLKNIFPAIALIVSGGHTILLLMTSLSKWRILGETRDDAVGESFDKVAKMLGLPYPGGPEIQKLAKKGNSQAIEFPRPMIHSDNFDFSYSGLKTSVLYYLRNNPNTNKADIAASFEQAAIDVLIKKTKMAIDRYNAKSILVSGGVASNALLRSKIKQLAKLNAIDFFVPPINNNMDNAVMIGIAGYISFLKKKNRKLVAKAGLGI